MIVWFYVKSLIISILKKFHLAIVIFKSIALQFNKYVNKSLGYWSLSHWLLGNYNSTNLQINNSFIPPLGQRRLFLFLTSPYIHLLLRGTCQIFPLSVGEGAGGEVKAKENFANKSIILAPIASAFGARGLSFEAR